MACPVTVREECSATGSAWVWRVAQRWQSGSEQQAVSSDSPSSPVISTSRQPPAATAFLQLRMKSRGLAPAGLVGLGLMLGQRLWLQLRLWFGARSGTLHWGTLGHTEQDA